METSAAYILSRDTFVFLVLEINYFLPTFLTSFQNSFFTEVFRLFPLTATFSRQFVFNVFLVKVQQMGFRKKFASPDYAAMPLYDGVHFPHLIKMILKLTIKCHLRITTNCLQRPPFCGPILKFYYLHI